MTRRTLDQSSKLRNVLYEIRGKALIEAARLESEGHQILKLNTGNPATFGFEAPHQIVRDMLAALPTAHGYSESKGVITARRAVVSRYEEIDGFPRFDPDDVFLGNGVSELITMVMQALLDEGDEVLIPAPDYPLWTAMTSLAGGTPVHYLCDEQNGWQPDLEDIRSKVTPRTKAIVVINPNNPTGAVYSREVLEGIVQIARENDLLLLSDEIYDRILFDEATHIPTATLAPNLLCLTFNGLSKTYRVAGYRSGWVRNQNPAPISGRLAIAPNSTPSPGPGAESTISPSSRLISIHAARQIFTVEERCTSPADRARTLSHSIAANTTTTTLTFPAGAQGTENPHGIRTRPANTSHKPKRSDSIRPV